MTHMALGEPLSHTVWPWFAIRLMMDSSRKLHPAVSFCCLGESK